MRSRDRGWQTHREHETMSQANPQRIRPRVASPSTKQGPIKAIHPFGLKQDPSPTLPRSGHSPTTNRNRISPGSGPGSPDRSSSPGPKGSEKFRPARQSPGTHVKRQSPFDGFSYAVPYLKGEWPRCSEPVTLHDKTTQTPEEWEETCERRKKASHKRSSSNGLPTSEGFVKKNIKGFLNSSKVRDVWSPSPSSPIPLSASISLVPPSKAVSIPQLHLRPPSKVRGSVEGFNQEIENFMEKHDNRSSAVQESTNARCRTIDTQTAQPRVLTNGLRFLSGDDDTDCSDHSLTPSPSPYTIMPGCNSSSSRDSCSPNDKENKADCDLKSCQLFVREPPDGCEKVKIIDEARQVDLSDEQHFCPIKKYASIPSAESAFCPLVKSYMQPSHSQLASCRSYLTSAPQNED